MGGSARQLELAEELAARWRSYKFDEVEMPEYSVLLSVPREGKPNRVTIMNGGNAQSTFPCQYEVREDSCFDPSAHYEQIQGVGVPHI